MSDEKVVKTLKSLTIKTEDETIERFNVLKEELGVATSGQMLTEMLDRMEQPQRIADHSKELQAEIDRQRQQAAEWQNKYDAEHAINEGLQAENEKLHGKVDELTGQVEEERARANQNAVSADAHELELQQHIDDLTLKAGQQVVTFTEDNLKVIQYVAARESKRRRQPWSISHVINWIVYARFIKGMLNADLEAVSDGELRRMGVNLKTKAKEAVEV